MNPKKLLCIYVAALVCLVIVSANADSQQRRQVEPAPARPAGEGDGPYTRLIIRGVTVVDGTGAPPFGPVDIVIEGNRITEVRSVGSPGSPIRETARPKDAVKEIDATGMYALPGFVDNHGHIGGMSQGTTAEYVYKLWLAHGITTVREPGSFNGVDWTLSERARSAKNEITAPRIFSYISPGAGWSKGPLRTPEAAVEFVKWASQKGVDGFKIIGDGPVYDPIIMDAFLKTAGTEGLGSTMHLAQLGVARLNILQAAQKGLRSMEHWYGLPESLFENLSIQNYPHDYNYSDESHRFSQAGRLWKQAAPPFSKKWNDVMDQLIQLNFTLDPTFTIYEATRDMTRAMRAEWHDKYTLPSLWKFYEPSRESHGSFWFNWTTQDEIEWKNNYRLWMTFVNEYKNRGGRVTTGSDSGFIYKLYGFDYIRELELLQEAGFHPLEVIRSATMYGAQLLHEPKGKQIEFGVIRPGMLADIIIVPENPVANLKVLYGTGTIKLNDKTGKVERVGGVKYTIKDGIVFDAKKLLADVERMVDVEKKKSQANGN